MLATKRHGVDVIERRRARRPRSRVAVDWFAAELARPVVALENDSGVNVLDEARAAPVNVLQTPEPRPAFGRTKQPARAVADLRWDRATAAPARHVVLTNRTTLIDAARRARIRAFGRAVLRTATRGGHRRSAPLAVPRVLALLGPGCTSGPLARELARNRAPRAREVPFCVERHHPAAVLAGFAGATIRRAPNVASSVTAARGTVLTGRQPVSRLTEGTAVSARDHRAPPCAKAERNSPPPV